MSAKHEPSNLDRAAAALSALVPFGFALARTPLGATWEGDLALLRGLALVGMPGAGGVSTLLVQLASLFPLGSLPFRAALVSAFALGLAGLVVFALARKLLLANLRTERLAPILAALASLATTLSEPLQAEAAIVGGATIALALGATTLLLLPRASGEDVRVQLLLGAALAASFVENAAVGAVLLLAVGAHGLASKPRPSRRSLVRIAAGLLTTGLVLALPTLVRAFAKDGSGARDLLAGRLLFLESQRLESSPAFVEIGALSLAVALAGLALGLLRPRLRAFTVALGGIVLVDALLPSLLGHGLAPLSALALAALFALAALGLQTAAASLLASPSQATAAAAILLVMLNVSLVAMTAETRLLSAPSRSAEGVESVTSEALQKLPPRAVLLVRSEPMARRLLSARLEEGARPDVTIVPTTRLSTAGFASKLLDEEAAFMGFVRDLAMDGRPKEHSLTTLADARPLLLELDPTWDDRLVSHLVAAGPWLRFAPQPLGRSDRERAFASARPAFERALQAATREDEKVDPATTAILAVLLRGHAASAGLLGDRDAALELLRDLQSLAPDDPLVAELGQWVASPKSSFRLEGRRR